MEPKVSKLRGMDTFIPFVNKFVSTLTDIALFRKQMNSIYISRDIIDKIRGNLAEIVSLDLDSITRHSSSEKCDLKSPYCIHKKETHHKKDTGLLMKTNDLLQNLKKDYWGVGLSYKDRNASMMSRFSMKRVNSTRDIRRHTELYTTKESPHKTIERSKSFFHDNTNKHRGISTSIRCSPNDIKFPKVAHTLKTSKNSRYRDISRDEEEAIRSSIKTDALQTATYSMTMLGHNGRVFNDADEFSYVLCLRTAHTCCQTNFSHWKGHVASIKQKFFDGIGNTTKDVATTRISTVVSEKNYKQSFKPANYDDNMQMRNDSTNWDTTGQRYRATARFGRNLSLNLQKSIYHEHRHPKARSLPKIVQTDVEERSLFGFNNLGSFENLRGTENRAQSNSKKDNLTPGRRLDSHILKLPNSY